MAKKQTKPRATKKQPADDAIASLKRRFARLTKRVEQHGAELAVLRAIMGNDDPPVPNKTRDAVEWLQACQPSGEARPSTRTCAPPATGAAPEATPPPDTQARDGEPQA